GIRPHACASASQARRSSRSARASRSSPRCAGASSACRRAAPISSERAHSTTQCLPVEAAGEGGWRSARGREGGRRGGRQGLSMWSREDRGVGMRVVAAAIGLAFVVCFGAPSRALGDPIPPGVGQQTVNLGRIVLTVHTYRPTHCVEPTLLLVFHG